jgi:hypothetical protein
LRGARPLSRRKIGEVVAVKSSHTGRLSAG